MESNSPSKDSLKPLPTLKRIPEVKRVIISSKITKNPVVLIRPPPPPPLMRIVHSPDKKDPSRLEKADERPTKRKLRSQDAPSPSKKIIQEIFTSPKKFRKPKDVSSRLRSIKRAVRSCRKKAEGAANEMKKRSAIAISSKTIARVKKPKFHKVKSKTTVIPKRPDDDEDDSSDRTSNPSNVDNTDDTDDIDSKKSDEETNGSSGRMGRRAAAAAALELVAKSSGKTQEEINKRMRKPQSKFCTRGKGRRTLIFKRKAKIQRGATEKATYTVHRKIIFNEEYFQIGDVVGFKSHGRIYYAQLRGFVVAPDGETSASLLWLVPKVPNPRPDFHVEDYTAYFDVRENLLLYKMESFTFIMHLALDHYTGPFKNSFVGGSDDHFGEGCISMRPGFRLLIFEKKYFNADKEKADEKEVQEHEQDNVEQS